MPKSRLIFALFAILVSSEVFSQPLQMHKTLGGAHFMRDTVYLSHKHVREILSVDPQASEEFKIALKNYRIGGVLGFSGAILLAIPVVSAIAGGDPEWLWQRVWGIADCLQCLFRGHSRAGPNRRLRSTTKGMHPNRQATETLLQRGWRYT